MKEKNDYFLMMEELSGYSGQAAEKLIDCIKNYAPAAIQTWRREMHAIENRADEARHELLRKLSREFITPIERDDILRLVQILDDVTDAVEEVVIDLYMYNVAYIPADAAIMAQLVLECVQALQAAVHELRFFKKPDLLMRRLVEVNNIESKADGAYMEAMRMLFASARDPMSIFGIQKIYDGLEACCDLCENAADTIEYIVMANT